MLLYALAHFAKTALCTGTPAGCETPAQAGAAAVAMRLFFKVLCVEPPQLLQLSADAKDTVRDVLARVQCGEPAEQLALVHEGKELTVSQSLDYAGVQDGATLHIICTRRTVRLLAKGQAADPSPAALTSPLSPGGAHRANIEPQRL